MDAQEPHPHSGSRRLHEHSVEFAGITRSNLPYGAAAGARGFLPGREDVIDLTDVVVLTGPLVLRAPRRLGVNGLGSS